MKTSFLWDITPKVNRPAFTLISCMAYSSTLKMEAEYSSEKSVDFQRTTPSYIPEDRTLQPVKKKVNNFNPKIL
jgi:hypothetical protein